MTCGSGTTNFANEIFRACRFRSQFKPLETFKSSAAFATIVQKTPVTLDRIGRAPLFSVLCYLPAHCSFDHPLVAWLAAAGITLPRLQRINTLFRYAQPFCDGTSQAECVLSSCFLCRKQGPRHLSLGPTTYCS